MDDVPLPKVDYDAGWHRQYTADQMHAHAAAVSAAKDAEIAQLRADLIKSLADNKALRERVRVLEDALRGLDEAYCRAGTPLTKAERHEDRMRLIAARAVLAARKAAP